MTERFLGMTMALCMMASCGGPPPTPVRPPTVPVRTATVTTQTVPLTVSYPAFTVSPRSVEIEARVEGFLLRQEVADGSVTSADQVIYRIDARPFEAQVAASQGQLATAMAQRDYAKKEMERNAPLVQPSAISQQAFDQLVANFQEAEGRVLTAQANLTTAQLNLSWCTMAAPFPGLLGASKYFEGGLVGTPSTMNLNSIVQLDPMWAQFSPAVSDWPKFAARMADGPLTATVTYGGAPQLTAPATIIFTDNAASTSTATLMMRVEFANPTRLFRPGTYCDVEVALGEIPNAIIIPQEALFARESDLFVWRVKADDTVEAVRVEVLRKIGASIVLASGPASGDTIVVEGIQRLRAGAKVTVVPPVAAPTSEAPKAP